jgi:hypothetical protein
LTVLLSAALRIEVRYDELVVGWDAIHAGLLPAPGKLLREATRELLGSFDSARVAARDQQLAFPNDWVWPNGKRRFRIADVSIQEGVARVTLEPFE